MSMVIGTNVASLTAQRHLASSRADMETSMERLASGSRINSAMDDAAGMAITHKLDSQISGLNQAARNANDGISMLQTAEGALEEVGSILNRMKELSVQASSDTYNDVDRDSMDVEFQALRVEITRISDNTKFNGSNSVIGSTSTVKFQIGDKLNDSISFTFQDMAANLIGTSAGSSATTNVAASAVSTHTTGTAAVNQAVQFEFTDADLVDNSSITVNVAGKTYTQAKVLDTTTGAGADEHMRATLTALAGQVIADKSNSKFNSLSVAVGADASHSKLILTATDKSATQVSVGTASVVTTVSSSGTGNVAAQDLQDQAKAESSIKVIDDAIAQVDSYRSKLGATANVLQNTVANIMNRVENHSATRSRIEDTDFAVESANLAKSQVLQQAGTAMLAQANASGQGVLSLLK